MVPLLLRNSILKNMMKLTVNPVAGTLQSFSASANSGKLAGKVAVVTASTDGIGFAIAKNLAENGASVIVSSRKEKNVTAAVEKLHSKGLKNVSGIVCHVGKPEDRENLFKEAVNKFGGVDILVSNAAVNPEAGPVLDCDEKVWDKIFEINVKAAYLLAKQAVPLMKKRGGGSIVFVSSIAGFQPFRLLGAYSVSKTALLGLTKAAAQDLAPDNIRVNCLAPGIVETKFSAAITSGQARDIALQMIPMNRLAEPDEMGGIVSFLCSNDASYITGETFVVAGGMQSRKSVKPSKVSTIKGNTLNTCSFQKLKPWVTYLLDSRKLLLGKINVWGLSFGRNPIKLDLLSQVWR